MLAGHHGGGAVVCPQGIRETERQVEKQLETQHLHSCQRCVGARQGGQDSSGHRPAFWEVSPSARPRGYEEGSFCPQFPSFLAWASGAGPQSSAWGPEVGAAE